MAFSMKSLLKTGDLTIAPSQVMKHLLTTGDYSDLTLTCKDKRFKVHKAVVCPQSPAINGFMSYDNVESKTCTVNVDFGLDATKSLIDFFYLEDYTVPVTNSEGKPTEMEDLLHHVRMDEIADYYLVKELRALAKKRIDQVLASSTLHQSAGFVAGLSTFLEFQHDLSLQARMAQVTSTNLRTCVGFPGFSELLEKPCNQGFVVAILKASATATMKGCSKCSRGSYYM